MLYWSIPLTHGGQPFASYVNRNNAAGFLEIALAAVAGWVIWSLSRGVADRGDLSRTTDPVNHLRRPAGEADPYAFHADPYGRLNLAGAITAAGLITAGIVCSLSRSGFIATVGGAIAVLLSLVGRRKLIPAASIAGGILAVSVAVVMWTGMGGAIEKRLATLSGEQKFADARLTNWRDAVQVAHSFPILGTGYGTYRFAYRPFQSRHHDVWFQHAENQYLQALVEGGAVGLALLIIAIVVVFRDVLGLARRRSMSHSDAVAACGLFAIVSQCLHAVFDFGLYLPANMLAMALICGAVAGSAKQIAQRTDDRRLAEFPESRPGFAHFAVIVVFAAWAWLAWTEVSNADVANRAAATVPPLSSPRSLELGEIDARIADLNAALRKRPDDAELHAKIADLWVYRYRRLAFQQLQPDEARSQKVWRSTDLAVLHRQANQIFRFDPSGSVDRMRETPLFAENLTPAVEHLLAARIGCPLLPEAELQLAALAFARNPGAPQGELEIRRAVQLGAGEPVVLYEAGVLAKQAGLKQLCFSSWKQSLALSSARQRQIMSDVRGWAKIDEILDYVLPDDPEVLLDVLSLDYGESQFAVERSLLMQRVRELAEAREARMPQSRSLHLQARIDAMEGRVETAIESFRRAVALSPFETAWRFELARLLKDQGRKSEAREQAEICLSLHPDFPGVNSFLEGLAAETKPRPGSRYRINEIQVPSEPVQKRGP
jgi:O-antigen ligase/tetratricopeptide (TPR) repeat protein